MTGWILAWLSFAFVVAAALAKAGESAGTRQEIRLEVWRAIAAELRGRGVAEQALPRIEQLDLPPDLPAAGRKLRVSFACWDAVPKRWQFRLECLEPGQCLPFLAYLAGENSEGTASDTASDTPSDKTSDKTSDPRAPVLDSARGYADSGSCRPQSGSHRVLAALTKPAVAVGDPATTVFLARGLRMTATVTCLERGREGEVIRVRSTDGHVFRARISGPGRLEALQQ